MCLPTQIRSSFSSVSSKLRAIKGVTLKVANKVYLKDGPYELETQMEEDAVKVFDAAIEKVNFGNSAAAAELINKWVIITNSCIPFWIFN